MFFVHPTRFERFMGLLGWWLLSPVLRFAPWGWWHGQKNGFWLWAHAQTWYCWERYEGRI